MKIPFRRLFSTFASPLLAGLLAASVLSAQAAQADAPHSIRIAVPDLSAGSQPSAGGVVDVLRSQQLLEQEFAKDGIHIDWCFFKGAGPVINEALANGQADFAYLGDLAAIIGKANGLDTRVLSAGVRGVKSYLAVVPGSGIHSLQDLKGKRVAVFRGTANQLSFASALASQGLSERDLKIINLDFNAANAAIAAKQIDATWGLSTLLSLRERGLVELPVNSRDLKGAGSTQAVLLGTGAFIDQHPDLVARLVTAQQKAVKWLRDENNRKAYVDLVASTANYPRVILEGDLAQENLAHYFDPRLDAEFVGLLQQGVDLAAKERLIRRGFQVSDWIEPRFLDAALQQDQAVQAAR
ncbi:ABC transporter substrate-binding protein [Pseudomonas guariconensis]|uniref:ABC transporter substrate-binding protein n=1 Tax=Pseudomonas TaxID=286 RepID=UPI0020222718|nr:MULTISPECIES: ABC transporter substrate-binding protein [Pseudomonas]MDM9596394.1 ABC transporter substrate-binding protein [Pseudomonas guariconensis]MDM9609224.1 ABC transporter substrate-binding protein [Pseudomonas guariconensis]MDM9614182.1 ABC transporter substrate-binding protein [Pseudomonas guariconensis]URD42446.1 ABC transporter substrate-binding protein [Pseudomonas sp. BYT-5]URK97796.1 ABC transporter substrate-binding protein [Pseudomonas sp. BYT-1]